ncbi:Dam family site-specific DNA-(adenine-N6)-methyltransferase [Candidatus Berkiella aquae]|uniref:Site-specific DNA-methyltransferase (adenine-specific) n=1 Tax=Candidatus Berkiella aquae TaxID=295108 RepID=A0A0Q9YZA5_9GAMM|nr:Dam family site-specific DNA-(adenine-N6)-methyltransferase [Candidatus Berkiella aquae]MCS5712732.1 Dam family site-specific DNA-(adenine-N6)-methyltransferase [Candidatus Berkiella aquae]
MNSSTLVRPFLKWPGGKFRLVPTLKTHLVENRYLVEPFAGAGALFLNTSHPEIMINDINPDLINIYRQLQQKGCDFILEAKTFFQKKYNRSKMYYSLRTRFNRSKKPLERALLFLYLNRHGYNGLCRYNLQGHYNVPFGDYQAPYFPHEELLISHARLQQVKLHCENFTSFLHNLFEHDLSQMVIYCDPPYAPLSKTANFTGYAAAKFTLDDQKILAEMARELAKKGAVVLISNHDTPFTRSLYRGAKLKRIEVSRTISCQANKRTKVPELIACFKPR